MLVNRVWNVVLIVGTCFLVSELCLFFLPLIHLLYFTALILVYLKYPASRFCLFLEFVSVLASLFLQMYISDAMDE